MIAFVLIITLITPKGDQVEVREDHPSKQLCIDAKAATVKAMREKASGYTLVELDCKPAPRAQRGAK